jgi:hypothetical protein
MITVTFVSCVKLQETLLRDPVKEVSSTIIEERILCCDII